MLFIGWDVKSYRLSSVVFVQNVVGYFAQTEITLCVHGHCPVLANPLGLVCDHRKCQKPRKQRLEKLIWGGKLRFSLKSGDNRPSVDYLLDVVLCVVEYFKIGVLLQCFWPEYRLIRGFCLLLYWVSTMSNKLIPV